MYSVLLRAVLFCIAFRDPSGFQFENCYNYCETHCEFHHLFNCFPYLPYSVALGNCVERYTPLPPTSSIFLQKPIILVHDRFLFFCLLHMLCPLCAQRFVLYALRPMRAALHICAPIYLVCCAAYMRHGTLCCMPLQVRSAALRRIYMHNLKNRRDISAPLPHETTVSILFRLGVGTNLRLE